MYLLCIVAFGANVQINQYLYAIHISLKGPDDLSCICIINEQLHLELE